MVARVSPQLLAHNRDSISSSSSAASWEGQVYLWMGNSILQIRKSLGEYSFKPDHLELFVSSHPGCFPFFNLVCSFTSESFLFCR